MPWQRPLVALFFLLLTASAPLYAQLIHGLPAEVWFLIFDHLRPRDLKRISFVSEELHGLIGTHLSQEEEAFFSPESLKLLHAFHSRIENKRTIPPDWGLFLWNHQEAMVDVLVESNAQLQRAHLNSHPNPLPSWVIACFLDGILSGESMRCGERKLNGRFAMACKHSHPICDQVRDDALRCIDGILGSVDLTTWRNIATLLHFSKNTGGFEYTINHSTAEGCLCEAANKLFMWSRACKKYTKLLAVKLKKTKKMSGDEIGQKKNKKELPATIQMGVQFWLNQHTAKIWEDVYPSLSKAFSFVEWSQRKKAISALSQAFFAGHDSQSITEHPFWPYSFFRVLWNVLCTRTGANQKL